MAVVQFFKENTLPGTLEPDSIYYVLLPNGLHVDTYITDASGNAKSGGVALIDDRIMAALTGLSVASAEVVPDIEARDAYIAGLEQNQLILVCDASDDPEVASGSALYIYEHGAATNPGEGEIHLVPGFNGVDVSLHWDNILGEPASTPTQIDNAVAASHTHSNTGVLNKLGENMAGNLTYGGNEIVGGDGSTQWIDPKW